MAVDDLPPTQPVVLEGEERSPGTSPAVAQAAAGGGSPQQTEQSPRQDSMQQRGGGPGYEDAQPGQLHSPPGSPCSGELRRGLLALGHLLRQAADVLLASRDLEQLRLLLLAAQRLGQRHPAWAECGGGAALEAIQRAVEQQYGWRLRLPGLLDAAAGSA